jgi:hypothetical protein
VQKSNGFANVARAKRFNRFDIAEDMTEIIQTTFVAPDAAVG